MANQFRHQHLRRLDRIWSDAPIAFITCCVADRKTLLAHHYVSEIFNEVWDNCESLYRWEVGSYVIMPDHVHFFCAGVGCTKPLATFVGKWKEWTAKNLARRHQYPRTLWQPQFFDHVMRSDESYTEKWMYVRSNPVRAGLVSDPESWPYYGTRHIL
ncbi:MAG: transposase [Verrucomicrobiaceae bacterium]|nr:transposase [Verrucomicrobiaceae bacterium]